jgi:hypothetical protein
MYPGDGGRTAGEGGGGPQDESFYRSENNFGSSSQVPGATAAGAGPGDAGGSSTGSDAAGSASGDVGAHGGAPDGSGSAGASCAGSPSSRLASRSLDPPADTGNTSLAANVVLLAAILLLATGVGLAGARLSRSRPRD